MPLIVIIEDDPTTRVLHAKALSDMDGYTVVTAGTLAEAQAILADSRPDLVLLDLRLPDGTGLDVLKLLRDSGQQAHVTVVSAFTEDLRASAAATSIAVLAKPIAPEELRCHVLEALQLRRKASQFTLPEYLQMACLGQHSVLLFVTSERKAGFIAVRKGEIWAASYSQLTAFEAFYAMAGIGDCSIEVRPWPEHHVPRELAGGYQELLLEAARRADEGRKTRPFLADDELDFSDLLASLDADGRKSVSELVAQGVRAVIARNYDEAVELLEHAAALEPNNAGIRHRLKRLYELGFGPAGEARRKPPLAG